MHSELSHYNKSECKVKNESKQFAYDCIVYNNEKVHWSIYKINECLILAWKQDLIIALCWLQAGCYKRHQSSSPRVPQSRCQQHLVGSYSSHCLVFIMNPYWLIMNVHTATTSWATCWTRSHHLGLACLVLASPSTSPPSCSMALLLSTTDSVLFSWVRCF